MPAVAHKDLAGKPSGANPKEIREHVVKAGEVQSEAIQYRWQSLGFLLLQVKRSSFLIIKIKLLRVLIRIWYEFFFGFSY